MESSSSTIFTVHPDYPPYLRQLITETINRIDPAYLVGPVANKLFDTHRACFVRLQGYALSRGFAVITITSKAKEA
jgi:hypothetical protein